MKKRDKKEKKNSRFRDICGEAFGELFAYAVIGTFGLLGLWLLKNLGLNMKNIDGDLIFLIGLAVMLLLAFAVAYLNKLYYRIKRGKIMKDEIKITFLGTCACDFSPRLKDELKDRFDNNARRSSAMLIDNRFLIDCGPHTLDALRIAGISSKAISDVIITHTHSDHYDPKSINELARGRVIPLNIWASEEADLAALNGVEIKRMRKMTRYTLDDGISVTGLPANHDHAASPQHIYFCKNGKKVFYGCDGAWLLNQTYYFLKDKKLDLAVLDCTTGDYEGDFRMGEHNSIPMLRVMLPSLRTFKVIDEHTEVYFSHLAPSLHAPHEETAKIADEMGAKVARDGLEFSV